MAAVANIKCGPYLNSCFSGQSSAGPTSRWKKLLVGALVIGVAGAAGMSLCMIKYKSCRQMCSLLHAWRNLLINTGCMLTAHDRVLTPVSQTAQVGLIECSSCQLASTRSLSFTCAGYFGYKHKQANQKTLSPAAQLADVDARIKVRPALCVLSILSCREAGWLSCSWWSA